MPLLGIFNITLFIFLFFLSAFKLLLFNNPIHTLFLQPGNTYIFDLGLLEITLKG